MRRPALQSSAKRRHCATRTGGLRSELVVFVFWTNVTCNYFSRKQPVFNGKRVISIHVPGGKSKPWESGGSWIIRTVYSGLGMASLLSYRGGRRWCRNFRSVRINFILIQNVESCTLSAAATAGPGVNARPGQFRKGAPERWLVIRSGREQWR